MQAAQASECLKTELGIKIPTPADGDHQEEEGHVPLVDKLTYGAPQLVTMAATFLLNVYGNRFYSLLGAPLSALAFYTALARSLDCLTDPVMGWWSDSTRSPHGRRRPYIMIGCGLYALCFTALLSPPDFGDQDSGGSSTAAWFGCFYILFYLCDTLSNIPYFAWGPELTPNYTERNTVFFVAKIFYFFGMLMSAMAPPLLYSWFRSAQDTTSSCSNAWDSATNSTLSAPREGESTSCNVVLVGGWCWKHEDTWFEAATSTIEAACEGSDATSAFSCQSYSYSPISGQRWSFSIVAGCFSLWYVLSMVNLTRRMRERTCDTLNDPVPLLPAILRSLKNIAFQPLIIGWALDAISLTALGTLFPFFIEYVIKPNGAVAQASGFSLTVEMALGFCMLSLLLSALVSMPLWLFMSQHFGKYNCFTAFNLVNAFTVFLFYFASEGDVKFIIFVALLCGIPVGGQFLTDSILADTIDYDEFLNGTRSEGSYTVFATLIPKFVSIPSSAVPLSLLAVLGFRQAKDGVAAEQPSSVESFIRITFVFVPFVCCCVSFVAKLYFPIKTRQISDAISSGIELHSSGASALDPITGRMIGVLMLSPQEADALWKYEYFSFKDLSIFLTQGHQPLVASMRKLTLICLTSFTLGAILSITMYPQLNNAGLSIIPVISIIVCGISLTGTLVNMSRWLAARSLGFVPPDVLKTERALVKSLIKAKGIGLGVDDHQSLSAQITLRVSRRALQAANGFHVVMSLALVGYGVNTVYWYPEAWFGSTTIAFGVLGLGLAVFGMCSVRANFERGMVVHFLSSAVVLTAVFSATVLAFLFKNDLKDYALYNPEEFLSYFPSQFCGDQSYQAMSSEDRRSCASKLSDKCFELLATVGIFGLVACIAGILMLMTEYRLVPSERFVTPLTSLFTLLIGGFNILVLVYASSIIEDWPELMQVSIGGMQFEGVLIAAIVNAVIVLVVTMFTGYVVVMVRLRDNVHDASKRLTIALICQFAAVCFVVAIAIVTFALVSQMQSHVEDNFDQKDVISASLNSCFCNHDSTSCNTLVCNQRDATSQLVYYEADGETPRNDECLARSACVKKLITVLEASTSAVGFFVLCEFFYIVCVILWLFRFRARMQGDREPNDDTQLATFHDEADEEEEHVESPTQDDTATLQQEIQLQEKIQALEDGIKEAVQMEHYMKAARYKEELDTLRLVQKNQLHSMMTPRRENQVMLRDKLDHGAEPEHADL